MRFPRLLNLLIIIPLFIFNSCYQTSNVKDKANKVFNEGVSFSLAATQELGKGNFDKSAKLNQKSIDKFLETLKIDSTHEGAASALGHSYYMTRDFQKGIEWYEKALRIDSTFVVSHLEYGLCKINNGDLANGITSINKALELDNSKETIDQAVFSLMDIGTLAFEYGIRYEDEGDSAKGLVYKQFSVAVLQIANQIDSLNLDVINYIVDFSQKLGDIETISKYQVKTD